MGQFNHPYVVKLYGVVTVGDPVSIIMYLWNLNTVLNQMMIRIELMEKGDLRGYLETVLKVSLLQNVTTLKIYFYVMYGIIKI